MSFVKTMASGHSPPIDTIAGVVADAVRRSLSEYNTGLRSTPSGQSEVLRCQDNQSHQSTQGEVLAS